MSSLFCRDYPVPQTCISTFSSLVAQTFKRDSRPSKHPSRVLLSADAKLFIPETETELHVRAQTNPSRTSSDLETMKQSIPTSQVYRVVRQSDPAPTSSIFTKSRLRGRDRHDGHPSLHVSLETRTLHKSLSWSRVPRATTLSSHQSNPCCQNPYIKLGFKPRRSSK